MNATITSLLAASPIDWQAVLDAAIADLKGSTGTLHRLNSATKLLTLVAQRGIPPHLMPVGKLSRYHILWEAEWKRIPPKDPILLQHIELHG